MDLLSLKSELHEWKDPDVAAYSLGVAIGIFPPNDPQYSAFRAFKGLLWTDNPLGSFLHRSLDELVHLGFLEHDNDEMKYRWKAGSSLTG